MAIYKNYFCTLLEEITYMLSILFMFYFNYKYILISIIIQYCDI